MDSGRAPETDQLERRQSARNNWADQRLNLEEIGLVERTVERDSKPTGLISPEVFSVDCYDTVWFRTTSTWPIRGAFLVLNMGTSEGTQSYVATSDKSIGPVKPS